MQFYNVNNIMQYQIQYWLQYCNITLFRYCNIVMLHIGFQYDGILLRIGYNIVMHRIADDDRGFHTFQNFESCEINVLHRGCKLRFVDELCLEVLDGWQL